MFYTIKIGHLERESGLRIGQILKLGDFIGTMGNTGSSNAAHVHIDAVYGRVDTVWRLADMERMKFVAAPKQLNRWMNNHLFNTKLHITTPYADPDYGVLHLAYDVVPENRKETRANWNVHFSMEDCLGELLGKGFDSGYGHYVLICVEVVE